MFDKINPGGRYAVRVRQLGSYAAPGRATPLKPAPSESDPDISDPLWGNMGGESDVAALWRLLRQLRLACKGLLTHLLELNTRQGNHWHERACMCALLCMHVSHARHLLEAL